jgi:hypothetical protein
MWRVNGRILQSSGNNLEFEYLCEFEFILDTAIDHKSEDQVDWIELDWQYQSIRKQNYTSVLYL